MKGVMNMKELRLTAQELNEYAEWLKKPANELTDDDFVEIVSDALGGVDVEYADALEQDSEEILIIYELNEEDEEDDEDYVSPSWSEKYLNTLGMSLRDF